MQKNTWFIFFILLFGSTRAYPQRLMTSYCNPLDLDYTYMIYNANQGLSYRSGADPAVVQFRGVYYLFVTRSLGYWYSKDLQHWQFITPEKWYFQGSNAPAAWNYKDSVLYVMGDPSGSMSVLYTDNPVKGDWKATPAILNGLNDPALFIDDNDSAYVFWGSSNVYPIKGKALEKNRNFKPAEKDVNLFNLDMPAHGWERFGENHMDTVLGGYIEGPWLTKHKGKYYMQYAAPGTEFNVYGDGYYTSDHPLGPYTYAPNNPFSYKPGGFINGAGHGSTVEGMGGLYWHFGSMAVSVNVNWERRLCMFPTFFDRDGLMYSDTYFGDYPHYAPSLPHRQGGFRGWMLLSFKKPATASSSQKGHEPEQALDENVKTFWLAEKNNDQQWLQLDLGTVDTVWACQVNYHDHQNSQYGRVPGLHHRYIIEGSADGRQWITMEDKSQSFKDAPNDYIEWNEPYLVRFIRYRHIEVTMPSLAISGLRVFGKAKGQVPANVKGFSVSRKADRRDVDIRWQPVAGAQGYNILWGLSPDKLYNSWMVYEGNSLLMKSLNRDQAYYFSIESFNEKGISTRTPVVRVD